MTRMTRMTREEAIEFGNMWLQINDDSKNSTTYKFFQIAIKALEQENILDKIRAEIDEQADRVYPYDISCSDGLEMALGIIDKYKAESEDKE